MNLYDGGSLEFTASALGLLRGRALHFGGFCHQGGLSAVALVDSRCLSARLALGNRGPIDVYHQSGDLRALAGLPGRGTPALGRGLRRSFLFRLGHVRAGVAAVAVLHPLCAVGLMLAGVGAALYPLAIAGVLAHSFSSVFYQSLLAMGVGATSGQICAPNRRPSWLGATGSELGAAILSRTRLSLWARRPSPVCL